MWRARVILREIAANLAAERWRAVGLVITTGTLVTTAVVMELGQVRAAVDLDAELSEAGRYVLISEAGSPDEPLDAGRCVALSRNPAVLAAGGYTESGRVTLGKAPGEVLVLRSMVGLMDQLLSPASVDPGDVYLAFPAAERIGLATGMTVSLGGDGGTARVSVLSMEARVPDPGPWVWTPTAPHAALEECWVEISPAASSAGRDLVAAWLTQGDAAALVRPLLAEDRFRIEPIEQFRSRPTRFAWFLASFVMVILVTIITWFRRSELALYRTAGASLSITVLIFVIPYVALVVVGVCLGAATGAYVDGLGAPVVGSNILLSLRQAGLALLAATPLITLSTLAIARGKLSNYIRQRL